MMALWHGISEAEASSSLKRLTNSISEIEGIIRDGANLIKGDPSNFPLELSLNSMKMRQSDLLAKMADIMSHRIAENVNFSLDGELYKNHSADILSISTLLYTFQRLFSSVAQAITKGPTERGRIGEELELLTRFRLAYTYPSSFGVGLAINTTSDLFGDSIALTTLRTFFALINSFDNKADVLGRANALSQRSMGHFRYFFRTLLQQKASPKISWAQPNGETKSWEASPERIAVAASNIESIKNVISKEVEVKGFLAGASLIRNKFEFISDKNAVYTGRVSNQSKPLLGHFFAKKCTALIETVVSIDKITNDEKTTFILKHLKS